MEDALTGICFSIKVLVGEHSSHMLLLNSVLFESNKYLSTMSCGVVGWLILSLKIFWSLRHGLEAISSQQEIFYEKFGEDLSSS